ncbi:MAG: response regulator [Candidatus Sulfotelmatobacter sp.]
MTLTSLLVCADEASADVLRRVLEELSMRVEACPDVARAGMRLAQTRFDLIILDGDSLAAIVSLLQETRASRLNDATLTVAILPGQESIREMFSLGVNFVLYKPVLYERALSSLRAAQSLLRKDKRRNARATVFTHATLDYAGEEHAKATLVDLAQEGMAVHYGKKFPPTCKVYFQFQLPGQTTDVRLSGQVMWQDWNGRAGIQFVDVPQASRRVLQEWLRVSLADAPAQEFVSDFTPVEHPVSAGRDATSPQPDFRELVASGGRGSEELNSSPHAEFTSPDPDNTSSYSDFVESPTEQQFEIASEREAAARLRSEPSNRRGKARYACRIGAEVYKAGTSVRNYCHLSDLGPGGCYLEMPLAFPSGTVVDIIVRTHEMKMRLSGEVCASHPGSGMGISFKLNTKDERNGVQQLIDFVAAAAESSS